MLTAGRKWPAGPKNGNPLAAFLLDFDHQSCGLIFALGALFLVLFTNFGFFFLLGAFVHL
jgi:hypothetical protein